jgi:hypothetical protein
MRCRFCYLERGVLSYAARPREGNAVSTRGSPKPGLLSAWHPQVSADGRCRTRPALANLSMKWGTLILTCDNPQSTIPLPCGLSSDRRSASRHSPPEVEVQVEACRVRNLRILLPSCPTTRCRRDSEPTPEGAGWGAYRPEHVKSDQIGSNRTKRRRLRGRKFSHDPPNKFLNPW